MKTATSGVDGRHLRTRRTRRAVVVAATELFVRHGYAATSMASIAERAGVAVQTLYASFGTKRAILSAALDQAIAGDDEAIVVNDRDWMHDVFAAPTAARRLRAYASAVTRILTGAGDLLMVVRAAAAVDPEAGELAATAEEQRRAGAASVVDSALTVGRLRPGLTRDEAVDVLWLLNAPPVFDQLVRRAGWPTERFADWLGDAMVRELLATDDGPRVRRRTTERDGSAAH